MFYMAASRDTNSIAHKKALHQAKSNPMERGRLSLFLLHFLKLKLCIVVKLNLVL